jgi:protein TonB
MFSTKRHVAVLSSLILAVLAPQAMAANQAARIEAASCEKPEFPMRWQTDGDNTDVLVAFLVDADGKVVESKVLESSGDTRVDRASARAGSRCSFKPGAKDGKAAASWTQVRYSWVLN